MRSRPLAAAWPLLALCALLASTTAADAAPEGQVTYAFHVTLAPRWLDPGETESAITPFKVLYAIHDALVKPMPAGQTTPSLAETWSMSPDGLSYTFVLRPNARFHNGEPVTADDVKFSFDRYKGGAAKLLKDKVKDVQAVDSKRVSKRSATRASRRPRSAPARTGSSARHRGSRSSWRSSRATGGRSRA